MNKYEMTGVVFTDKDIADGYGLIEVAMQAIQGHIRRVRSGKIKHKDEDGKLAFVVSEETYIKLYGQLSHSEICLGYPIYPKRGILKNSLYFGLMEEAQI